jgi:hypothetical protein
MMLVLEAVKARFLVRFLGGVITGHGFGKKLTD